MTSHRYHYTMEMMRFYFTLLSKVLAKYFMKISSVSWQIIKNVTKFLIYTVCYCLVLLEWKVWKVSCSNTIFYIA